MGLCIFLLLQSTKVARFRYQVPGAEYTGSPRRPCGYPAAKQSGGRRVMPGHRKLSVLLHELQPRFILANGHLYQPTLSAFSPQPL